MWLIGPNIDYKIIERLIERYGQKIIYVAVGNIKKGDILKDNNIELYFDSKKKYDDDYADEVRDIIKLGKPFLGLRAISDISDEEELKSTLFEDAKFQIERDKKNQTIKEKRKLQIKNNIWL